MQLVIGRDKATSKLAITVDSKTYMWGTDGIVPATVSRQHCMLVTEDGINMKIKNLKQQNVTWVNGLAIDSCTTKRGKDRIELGVDRFLLDWNAVNEVMQAVDKSKPKEIDISHLGKIWDNYHYNINKMQKHQAFINAYRAGVPLLTIGGVAAAYFMGDKTNGMMPVLYVIAAVIMCLFFIIGIIDASRNPKLKEKLNRDFTKKYCCPNCHYFFGYQAFDILKNNMDVCPKCRAKIKK